MTFKDFGFNDSLIEGLDAMGFENPTPVQSQAIPIIVKQKDLIACAQTGTGKTAAFILPIINKLSHRKGTHINTLVIAPTRELAIQIDQQIEGFAYFTGVNSCPVYGGSDSKVWTRQEHALKHGTDIVIATPGRLLSHLTIGNIDFSKVEHLVLDEADRMLDMGFYEDIMRIVKSLPTKRQTLLFSATMPHKIRKLAQNILSNPESVNVAISKPAETIKQEAYLTHNDQKAPAISHILKKQKFESVLIFSSTKKNVDVIRKELQRNGFAAAGISSDLEQNEREEVLRDFKANRTPILVATDIMSRGIDIKGIDLVINYDVPSDAEDYIHRIGRTGRNEADGHAITLVNTSDQEKFSNIENLMEKVVDKIAVPEELGKGPEYDPEKYSKSGGKRKKPNFRDKRKPQQGAPKRNPDQKNNSSRPKRNKANYRAKPTSGKPNVSASKKTD